MQAVNFPNELKGSKLTNIQHDPSNNDLVLTFSGGGGSSGGSSPDWRIIANQQGLTCQSGDGLGSYTTQTSLPYSQ